MSPGRIPTSADRAEVVPVMVAADLRSRALVVRENLIPSREPEQCALQGLGITGTGLVDIETQGQVGESRGVLVGLLKGERKASLCW